MSSYGWNGVPAPAHGNPPITAESFPSAFPYNYQQQQDTTFVHVSQQPFAHDTYWSSHSPVVSRTPIVVPPLRWSAESSTAEPFYFGLGRHSFPSLSEEEARKMANHQSSAPHQASWPATVPFQPLYTGYQGQQQATSQQQHHHAPTLDTKYQVSTPIKKRFHEDTGPIKSYAEPPPTKRALPLLDHSESCIAQVAFSPPSSSTNTTVPPNIAAPIRIASRPPTSAFAAVQSAKRPLPGILKNVVAIPPIEADTLLYDPLAELNDVPTKHKPTLVATTVKDAEQQQVSAAAIAAHNRMDIDTESSLGKMSTTDLVAPVDATNRQQNDSLMDVSSLNGCDKKMDDTDTIATPHGMLASNQTRLLPHSDSFFVSMESASGDGNIDPNFSMSASGTKTIGVDETHHYLQTGSEPDQSSQVTQVVENATNSIVEVQGEAFHQKQDEPAIDSANDRDSLIQDAIPTDQMTTLLEAVSTETIMTILDHESRETRHDYATTLPQSAMDETIADAKQELASLNEHDDESVAKMPAIDSPTPQPSDAKIEPFSVPPPDMPIIEYNTILDDVLNDMMQNDVLADTTPEPNSTINATSETIDISGPCANMAAQEAILEVSATPSKTPQFCLRNASIVVSVDNMGNLLTETQCPKSALVFAIEFATDPFDHDALTITNNHGRRSASRHTKPKPTHATRFTSGQIQSWYDAFVTQPELIGACQDVLLAYLLPYRDVPSHLQQKEHKKKRKQRRMPLVGDSGVVQCVLGDIGPVSLTRYCIAKGAFVVPFVVYIEPSVFYECKDRDVVMREYLIPSSIPLE